MVMNWLRMNNLLNGNRHISVFVFKDYMNIQYHKYQIKILDIFRLNLSIL